MYVFLVPLHCVDYYKQTLINRYTVGSRIIGILNKNLTGQHIINSTDNNINVMMKLLARLIITVNKTKQSEIVNTILLNFVNFGLKEGDDVIPFHHRLRMAEIGVILGSPSLIKWCHHAKKKNYLEGWHEDGPD